MDVHEERRPRRREVPCRSSQYNESVTCAVNAQVTIFFYQPGVGQQRDADVVCTQASLISLHQSAGKENRATGMMKAELGRKQQDFLIPLLVSELLEDRDRSLVLREVVIIKLPSAPVGDSISDVNQSRTICTASP